METRCSLKGRTTVNAPSYWCLYCTKAANDGGTEGYCIRLTEAESQALSGPEPGYDQVLATVRDRFHPGTITATFVQKQVLEGMLSLMLASFFGTEVLRRSPRLRLVG